ncbi:MAG: hypothetical protein KatS3mg027_1063 [Bacteroidia bacterium]|nr:MAG: hypothetical protein KatS3mg027_1063 [Bacteroidia bacterium]
MILELFAHILSYPTEDLKKKTARLIELLEQSMIYNSNKNIVSAVDHLKVFYLYLEKTNIREQEEVYTQTFEVQSITTLDVGYILFGDDYKRAELLVNLNQEIVRYAVNTSIELADHLPNILKLLHKMEDDILKSDLINIVVYPVLKRIIKDFDSKIIESKNKVYLKHQKTLIEKSKEYRDIYVNPLLALKYVLEAIYEAEEIVIEDKSKGFLSNIEQELNIEKI